MDFHSGLSNRGRVNGIFLRVFIVQFCHFCLFKAEEKAKARAPSASKDKGGAKVSDKKEKNPPSPGPSKDKKTKFSRRDDVEPPKFIGKNSN